MKLLTDRRSVIKSSALYAVAAASGFWPRFSARAAGIGWDAPSAQSTIKLCYIQILERSVDGTGLNDFTAKLVNQNMSTQELVLGLALSDEYRSRFIAPWIPSQNWHPIVTKAYQHFFDRAPENEGVIRKHSELLHQARYEDWLRTLVYSNEYDQKWGNLGVPHFGRVPVNGGANTAMPNGQLYYFKLSNSQSSAAPCITDGVYAISQSAAKQKAESDWSGYVATPIDAAQYADYATCAS